jgi:L,D-transpeptidase ErfK/SrfK
MRVSRGCIRMFPEDIESLFERVPNGTKVNIIDQPFKAGWSEGGVLYLQAFPPLEEHAATYQAVQNAMDVLSRYTDVENLTAAALANLRQHLDSPNGLAVPLRGPLRRDEQVSD